MSGGPGGQWPNAALDHSSPWLGRPVMVYLDVGGTFTFGEIERRCVNKRAQLVVKRRIVKTSNSRGDNTLSHTNSTGAELTMTQSRRRLTRQQS